LHPCYDFEIDKQFVNMVHALSLSLLVVSSGCVGR